MTLSTDKVSDTTTDRHPVRTWLIRGGITLTLLGSGYVIAGLLGWVPLELEKLTLSNIRIVSGVAILGCLMAAVGYGND